jgi:hypothetical protein
VDFEPLGTFAGLAGLASAGGLVLAGADPGPRGEPRRVAKAGHVDPDLGHHRLGAAAVDAGDDVEQFDLSRERGDHPVDLFAEAADGFVEVVKFGQPGFPPKRGGIDYEE